MPLDEGDRRRQRPTDGRGRADCSFSMPGAMGGDLISGGRRQAGEGKKKGTAPEGIESTPTEAVQSARRSAVGRAAYST